MASINLAGLYFFMPIFSFLFVFIVTYAILFKTKILGESQFVNILVGLIIAIIFMSFSTSTFSTDTYIRTIIPWFAVLFVSVFLVLLLMGLSTKDLGSIMTSKFAWAVAIILIVIFVIAAIRVFNPVLDPTYGVASGDSPQIISQLRDIFGGPVGGGILLVIIAIIVAYVISRAK
ncbi:hypothetical protein GOV12_03025 [Candidatus Pacearchaeota archaeon]|nr:hypothetical protein [Candidatus Pacearchaeota archaeon]